jgi:chorismate mutase
MKKLTFKEYWKRYLKMLDEANEDNPTKLDMPSAEQMFHMYISHCVISQYELEAVRYETEAIRKYSK